MAFEDLVLERVELVADLPEHREAVVEAVVDQAVHQVAGAAGEELLAELLVVLAAGEQVLDRGDRLVRQGDHEVGTDEQVELAGAEPAGLAVEHGHVEDQEEVVRVLVDLRALVAREHVLDVEGVELEVLFQPGALGAAGMLDVEPAEAFGLDHFDLGLGRFGYCLSAR